MTATSLEKISKENKMNIVLKFLKNRKFKATNAFLDNHQDIVTYGRFFSTANESHYLLHCISKGRIKDFSEFEKIYANKEELLNRLKAERENPCEVAQGKCGMGTALANIDDMEKIINERAEFYELCKANNTEPNLALNAYFG